MNLEVSYEVEFSRKTTLSEKVGTFFKGKMETHKNFYRTATSTAYSACYM